MSASAPLLGAGAPGAAPAAPAAPAAAPAAPAAAAAAAAAAPAAGAAAGGAGLPPRAPLALASASSSPRWLAQVHSVQQARLSPSDRAAFLARQEASRSARAMQAASHMLQQQSSVSADALQRGLRASNALSLASRAAAPPAAFSFGGGGGGFGGGGSAHLASPASFGFAVARPAAAAPGAPVHAHAHAAAAAAGPEEMLDMRDGASAARAWAAVGEGSSAVFARSRALASAAVASPHPAAAMAAGAAFGGFGGGGGGAAPLADEGQRAGIAEALLAIEAGVVAAPAAAEDAAAVAPLLDQLIVEPADASELAAKFAIFEQYLATVSALREQVLALWSGARASFDAAPAAAMDRALAKIDDGANLGVADVAGVWLVHGMLKAATRNHAAIAALVRDLETKLRLIADDADCPMCLSSLGEGEGRVPAKVLSCCHKTCRESIEASLIAPPSTLSHR
jgi:hypothetical protein